MAWFGHRAPVEGIAQMDMSPHSALPDEIREGCDFVAGVTIEPEGNPAADRAERAQSNVAHFGKLGQMIKDAVASGDNAAIDQITEKMERVVSSEGKVEKVEYIGESARGTRTLDGAMVIHSVAIGNYVIRDSLIGSEVKVKKGSTPVHSVRCLQITQEHLGSCSCEACTHHPPCSTIADEGMVHREELEGFIGALFAHLRKLEGLA